MNSNISCDIRETSTPTSRKRSCLDLVVTSYLAKDGDITLTYLDNFST